MKAAGHLAGDLGDRAGRRLLPAFGHPRPAPRGRQPGALRRLADDPLRPEDAAGDRRALTTPGSLRYSGAAGLARLPGSVRAARSSGRRSAPERGGDQPMTQPTFEDARRLGEWRPPLGVLSVYLAFDPADRGGAWRTELRNGLERSSEAAKDAEHERRVALRASPNGSPTASRTATTAAAARRSRLRRGRGEGWRMSTGAGRRRAGASACVEFGRARAGAIGRPRLPRRERGSRPRAGAGPPAELGRRASWRKLEGLGTGAAEPRLARAQGARRPRPAHGVASSGHDEFGERLDHNRRASSARPAGCSPGGWKGGIAERWSLRPRGRPRELRGRACTAPQLAAAETPT